MEVVVRFGQVSDKRQISSLDKHIRDMVLNWKLQHQEIIVAVGEDGIVGYVRVEYLWSKYPYIGLILVREKYQRLGIGKKLLSFLETHLNKQGISLLYSSSQANEHEPQQWHKHMGFVECGMINGINDGIGEVFFVKDLREGVR